MKKIVSLALVLVMIVAAFAGCAPSEGGSGSKKKTDQEQLIGTWKGDMDLTEAIMQEVGEGMEGFELDEFKVTAVFTFKEDGTYTLAVDEDSAEEAFEGLVEDLEKYMKDMLEEQAQEAGMSLEDLLTMSGMTLEDLTAVMTEALEEENVVEELVESFETKGKFKAEKGKLYTTSDEDEEISEDVYDTYKLDGDVLTLEESFGADEEDKELLSSVYPVVLKKAS